MTAPTTGSFAWQLPTATPNLSDVLVVTPTGTQQSYQKSLLGTAQYLQSQGQMISGSYTLLNGKYQPSGTASGGTDDGYIQENTGQLTYITGSSYRAEAGGADVNGSTLTWSSPITRSGLSLTSGTLYYTYLYSNAGTPALEESTTVPVWDSALNYFKKTGDATRRCIGFIEAGNTNAIRKFLNIVMGRISEFIYIDGAAQTEKRVVAGGTTTASWASFSLSPLIPVHATHGYFNAKLSFAAGGDDGILGLSPISLGSGEGDTAPFTVRERASGASATFFGSTWLAIKETQTYYYRLFINAGTPSVFIEAHGARIIR